MTARVIAKCAVERLGHSVASFNPIALNSLFFLSLGLPLLAQTTVSVSNTVLQSGVKRIGINLGGQDFYDSDQFTKNLVNLNPSFSPTVWHSRIVCSSASANNCTAGDGTWSGTQYVNGATLVGGSGYTDGVYVVTSTGGGCSTQPVIKEIFQGGSLTDFVMLTTGVAVNCSSLPSFAISASAGAGNGASITPYYFWPPHTPITVVTGAATGCTTTANYNGATFFFDTACSAALAAGDYVDVGPVTFGGANTMQYAAEYPSSTGNGFASITTDVPPSPSNATQALSLTAPSASDTANVTLSFDSTNGATFIKLNGTYQISYWAKGISGSEQVVMLFGRPGNNYLSPTVQTLTNSWAQYTQTFTVSETGNPCAPSAGPCTASLIFQTVNADKIYLDNISLSQCSQLTTGGCVADTNPTVFRDEVVSRLRALNPGVLRMWTGSNLTMSLDDLLADSTARHPTNYFTYRTYYVYNWDGYSLPDFLNLVQYLGNSTEASIVVPITFNTTDASNLIDYLSGPATNGCTVGAPYALKRCKQGYPTPWTSVIPKIHLEYGNEAWNDTFSGGAMQASNGTAYGAVADRIFAAMKANANYVAANMDLVLDGFGYDPNYLQQTQAVCSHNDSVEVAPYMMASPTDVTTPNQWNSTLAEPQAFWYGSGTSNNAVSAEGVGSQYLTGPSGTTSYYGGVLYLDQLAAQYSGNSKSLAVYEENFATQSGNYTQAQLDAYTPSLGAGLSTVQEELLNIQNGVKLQNIFTLGQWKGGLNSNTGGASYFYGWGAVVDIGGPTNLSRPQFLAAQLANIGIPQGGNMLAATVSSQPTVNVSNVNTVTMPNASLIQAFAFNNGANYSLELLNNDSAAHAVTFSGANAPTGTITVNTLTSSSPNDTNETSSVVAPNTSTLMNPSGMTLPAYSEVVLTWNTSTNSCTPLNRPAYGPFSAVVNGIDAIDWGVARVQWTSSSMPISLQRIQYATDAEWTANPGVYPHTEGLQTAASVTTTTTPQGWILSNLLPGTTYHVAGQSYDGSTWCAAPDVTFTTLPYPGIVTPQMPAQVTNIASVPTVTGTDYLYGSTCGTSGIVQTRLQDCLNRAKAGDGIGIPPGIYNTGGLQGPNNPNAVQFTVTGSTINSTAHGLSNGQLIRFSSDNQYGGYTTPAPLQPGVTYKVINATANTFQASYDGVTPLTLTTSGGGNLFYLKWPPAPNYVLIHSTAPSSQLPPPGVRFDPVAYGSQVPNLQLNDPNRSIFAPGVFMSYYWFQNLEFSTDPAIATQDSGNGVDPPDFAVPVETSSDNDHIVFNQGAVIPAPPPSRTFYLAMNGSNIVYMNSVIEGFDFWQIYRAIQASSTTSTTYTIPAGSVYWVGANGAKQSCTVASPQTLTFTGGTVGNFAIWIDPANCNLNAQLQTGLTATGSGFTITSAANPSYPTYSWTGPNSTFTLLNVLAVGTGTVGSGAVSFGDFDMSSSQDAESGVGIHVGNGPGPFLIQNNLIQGTGVAGTYLSDDITSGTGPCGGIGGLPACAPMYNTGDLTEKRNTIRANPCYWAGSACWNGGNYYWRNTDEVKQGKNIWQDGNVWGPFYLQIAQGACVIHVTFTAEFSYATNFLDYADSSNWNFTNNTCQQTPEIVDSVLNYTATAPTYPLSHMRIHNNLFYQDNAYAQIVSTIPQAFGSVVNYDNSQGACPYGKVLQIGGAGDDFQFDHNTIFGLGGCQAWFYNQFAVLSSGNVFTNNIFNLVSDPGTWSVYLGTGTLYQSNASLNPGSSTSDNPDCTGFQASALFACMNYFTWQNNVVLATWTDSHPGSTVDYTNAQIATAAALFPASPATYFPTAGTTMNDRVKQVSWFNPSTGNFRLSTSSPYISGARASTDGLDVGVDMDALEAAQGKVSNVHTYGTTSTSTTIGYLAPDSFGCTIDWGTSNFVTGSGSYTRVANAGGQRVQNVTLSGLPADSLIYYRVNCAVQQPTGTVKLP